MLEMIVWGLLAGTAFSIVYVAATLVYEILTGG
jgi:hypothetical protein